MGFLMNMFQGKVQISDCMFRKHVCPNLARCVLRRRLKSIEDKLLSEFENISIGGLLKDLERIEQ